MSLNSKEKEQAALMPQTQADQQNNAALFDNNKEQVNILIIWRLLFYYKRLIAATVLICVTVGFILALVSPSVYQADVLLAPANSDSRSNNGIGGIASQLGGLAGLAGINVSSGQDIETAIATLKSRKFITHFVTKYNLKPILFAEQWNKQKNEWLLKKPSLSAKIKSIIFGLNVNKPYEVLAPGEPSSEEVYKLFSEKMLRVSQDPKSQLITVSIGWKDPQQAADWDNLLVKTLNNELRQAAIKEAERSIEYLKEQIKQTSLADLQNVLYQLIEEHIKKITLAKVNDEYVMKIIDPAVPPDIPYKPNRKLIIIIGFLIGVMFGLLLVFVLNAINKARQTMQ